NFSVCLMISSIWNFIVALNANSLKSVFNLSLDSSRSLMKSSSACIDNVENSNSYLHHVVEPSMEDESFLFREGKDLLKEEFLPQKLRVPHHLLNQTLSSLR